MNMKSILSIMLIGGFSLVFNPNRSFCQVHQQNNQTVIQQNQQNVNIYLPVIEKKVYIERYRTVYVEKPRVARKLNEPIQLLGYLWVYPEDLGNFKSVPLSVIANLNSQSPYGRNNWRIPTPDELAVLEANADKVGLGDDIYLATDHRNGVLRLVSTGEAAGGKAAQAYDTGVTIYAGTKWADKNYGAANPMQVGYEYDYTDMQSFTPPLGWRLPTISELKRLADIDNYSYMPKGIDGIAYNGGFCYRVPDTRLGGPLTLKLWFPFNKWWGGDYWCIDTDGHLRKMTIYKTLNDVDTPHYNSDTAAIRLVKE